MRKNYVLMTMALAGVMTVGMAITSLAGWVQTNGNWYYYNDRNNEMVRDEWAPSGDNMYYLGHDGIMKTNSFIDDTYYVDANGAMVKNGWQYFSDDWDEEPKWRYFASSGRAYEDGMKQIDGVYYHFSDTEMSTGWVDSDNEVYYFNESGARVSGWRELPGRDEDDWDEYWYYFTSAGKMVKKTTREIQDALYIFDEEGRMLTGWVNISDFTSTLRDDLSSGDFDNLRYFEESGAAANGWKYMDSAHDLEASWYYFRDGRPYSTNYKATEVGDYGMVKINNEYYCFDEEGKLVTGLVEANGKYFYFDDENGQMQTGKMTVYSDDFYNEIFYFATSGSVGERGAGVTGVKDGYLYEDGLLVKAEDGIKYDCVEVGGKEYVVNESGKVKTSGTAKSSEGVKYTIKKNSNGTYDIKVEYDD